jgi:hypothetical protein
MPVKRRLPKFRILEPELTETQRVLLFDRPLPAPATFDDRAQVWAWRRDDSAWGDVPGGRDLWRQHADSVLREWVLDRPGTRPSGWWRFSADRPRERPRVQHQPSLVESEASYLLRNNLLLPGERRRLRAADFRPERCEDEG